MPFAFFHTQATEALDCFCFRLAKGGAHTSRTMMLRELEMLLRRLPEDASEEHAARAVVVENLLGKETISSRRKTLIHLKELYVLKPAAPLFSALRALYRISPDSLPQLALLVALARDPLLRASAEAVLPLSEGSAASTADFLKTIESGFHGAYSQKSMLSISQNCASSWTQARHLLGRRHKIRSLITPTPAGCVLALLLSAVSGHHGASMFASPWCRCIDLDPERARSVGFEAHRRGLLTLRSIGEVVEVSFPSLPTSAQPPK